MTVYSNQYSFEMNSIEFNAKNVKVKEAGLCFGPGKIKLKNPRKIKDNIGLSDQELIVGLEGIESARL